MFKIIGIKIVQLAWQIKLASRWTSRWCHLRLKLLEDREIRRCRIVDTSWKITRGYDTKNDNFILFENESVRNKTVRYHMEKSTLVL